MTLTSSALPPAFRALACIGCVAGSMASALLPAQLAAAAPLEVVPPPETSVTWLAPPTCPTPRQVEQGIADRLGRPLARDELRLHGTIEQADGQYHLRLQTEVDGRTDARTLTAADCATLGEAAMLLGALSLDPVQTAATLFDARADEAPVELDDPPMPEPAPPAREPVRPTSEPERPSEGTVDEPSFAARTSPGALVPEVIVALEGGAAFNIMPGPSGAAGGRAHLLWRRFGLQLGGHYLTPRTAARDEGRVRVQMGAVDMRACGLVRGLRWALPLCAGVELGAARGDGRGVDNPRTRHGVWFAAVASAGYWGWVHPRVGLGLRSEVTFAAVRPRFELRHPGPERELFAPPLVGVRLLASIQVRLLDPATRGRSRRSASAAVLGMRRQRAAELP